MRVDLLATCSSCKMMIMKDFFHKVITSLLISSSALYLAEVNSQTQPIECDDDSLLLGKARILYRLTSQF